MITRHLRYFIDSFKLKEFETYRKMWIPLAKKFGREHHGCFFLMKGQTTLRSRCSRFRPLPLMKLIVLPPPTRGVKQPCATTGKPGAF